MLIKAEVSLPQPEKISKHKRSLTLAFLSSNLDRVGSGRINRPVVGVGILGALRGTDLDGSSEGFSAEANQNWNNLLRLKMLQPMHDLNTLLK